MRLTRRERSRLPHAIEFRRRSKTSPCSRSGHHSLATQTLPPSKRPKKTLLLLRSGLHSGLDTTSMAFLITSLFLCLNMQWIRQTKPTKFTKLITAATGRLRIIGRCKIQTAKCERGRTRRTRGESRLEEVTTSNLNILLLTHLHALLKLLLLSS